MITDFGTNLDRRRSGLRPLLTALGAYAVSAILLSPAHALPLTGAGTIAVLGAAGLETWEFDANHAGGTVTVLAKPAGSLQLTEAIIAPDGTFLASATASAPGDPAEMVDVTLFLAGIYTITVEGFTGTPGDYDLQVTGNTDASISNLEFVPEPPALALLGFGLAGLGLLRRRTMS